MQFKRVIKSPEPEWITLKGLTPYPQALTIMEERIKMILSGTASEQILLLEHPSLYTAGLSARADELLLKDSLPVFDVGRGGKYTYHGPGQRIIYVMLNLNERAKDIRAFIAALEAWVIQALAALNISCERRTGRIGLWVTHQGKEEKIAALGVRLKQWVSFHGIAINVAPDLHYFNGIVPCGLKHYGVTSLHALGSNSTMAELDDALYTTFHHIF